MKKNRNNIKDYTLKDDYIIENPESYIQVIQGNGGNVNMEDGTQKGDDSIYLIRSAIPGFGRMIVHNETSVTLEAYESENKTLL
jgi:hypothetical protein